jgi:hypothetical protein
VGADGSVSRSWAEGKRPLARTGELAKKSPTPSTALSKLVFMVFEG